MPLRSTTAAAVLAPGGPIGHDAAVMSNTVLVTGAAGFIGHHLVCHLLATDHDLHVVAYDLLTYAAHPDTVATLRAHPRVTLVQGDVADRASLDATLATHRPRAALHLAAESHVDRSIATPDAFIHTNVVGTFTLLEALRAALLPDTFRLVHVSTDEVFGALEPGDAPFTEASPYAPRSPYAASKAAADHLVLAAFHTYGLPAIVTHSTNNYGPGQHPEKLIPRTLSRLVAGRPVPIYGDGLHVRDWLHVDDHAAALVAALHLGSPGQRYLFGARCERTNLDLAAALADRVDARMPTGSGSPSRRALLTHVDDRPGHDRRYAVDPTRAETELGWRATTPLEAGLDATTDWYTNHSTWTTLAP